MECPAESEETRPILALGLVVAAFAFGAFQTLTALFGSEQALLWGDEIHSIANLHRPWSELVALYDDKGSGIALPMLQRIAVELFGANVTSYRLPAGIASLSALALVYPVMRRFTSRAPAALCALALATSALHLYYSAFGRIYALLVPAGLIAALALARMFEPGSASKLRVAAFALAVAVLPSLHLTALGFVAGLGVACLAMLVLQRRPRGVWIASLACFAAGLLLALLFHLPAWDDFEAFVRAKSGAGAGNRVGPLEVAEVVTGNRASAVIGSVLAVAGALALVRRRRSAALIPICAAFVPVLALAVARPNGLPFAYARYLMAALPFLALCACVGLYELARLLLRRSTLALAASTLILVLHAAGGPRGIARGSGGTFAGCETNLVHLPAFDTPWNRTPPFYRDLGAAPDSAVVLEVPPLPNRANYLYRNYYLQHGKRIRVGTLFDETRGEPYVHLDGKRPAELGADYLVLHIDLEQEIANYWAFVFDTFDSGDRRLDLFMKSQSRHGHVRDQMPSILEIARELEAHLGPPAVRNRFALTWDLARVNGRDTPLRLDPTRPEKLTGKLARADALSDEASALASSGRLKAALAKCDEALAIASEHTPALVHRASVLAALGRFDESVRAFERTLAANPYLPDAHFNFGLLLLERGRRADGVEHLSAAAELEPDFEAEVRTILGN